MCCRWTVMSIRVCAANMGFLDTQLFSGSQKDPWNQKSKEDLSNQNKSMIKFYI